MASSASHGATAGGEGKFANLDPPEIAALPQHLHLLDWEHQAWRLTRGVHRRADQSATRQPV